MLTLNCFCWCLHTKKVRVVHSQLANECLMVSYGFLPSILQVWVAEGCKVCKRLTWRPYSIKSEHRIGCDMAAEFWKTDGPSPPGDHTKGRDLGGRYQRRGQKTSIYFGREPSGKRVYRTNQNRNDAFIHRMIWLSDDDDDDDDDANDDANDDGNDE